MIADTSHFIQRVVEEALGRSRTTGDGGLGNADGEALLAQLLGERLAGLFAADAQDPGGPDADARSAEEDAALLAHYDEVLARNQRVAGALGACDCWGGDAACPVCHGEGGPGWCTPDHHLFEVYVRPALRALHRSHMRAPNGSNR